MAKRLSQEEKEYLVGEYLSSGLSQREFCESIGLSPSTLYSWLRRGTGQSVGNVVELIPEALVVDDGGVRVEVPGGAIVHCTCDQLGEVLSCVAEVMLDRRGS